MFIKTSLFALTSLCLALTATHAQPSPQHEKPVAPIALPAEMNGLKISIVPTFRNSVPLAIELQKGDPHLNIVLQNVSDKPLSLYEEWNSWGAYNLTLEISAIDGKTLDKPLVISKGAMGWRANFPSTEKLKAGGKVARKVHLYLPKQVFAPRTPLTNEDLNPRGPLYFRFPFPLPHNSRMLTMRAVFENKDAKTQPTWTGKIASPLTQYRFFWNAK